jgi:hypothetical protein
MVKCFIGSAGEVNAFQVNCVQLQVYMHDQFMREHEPPMGLGIAASVCGESR